MIMEIQTGSGGDSVLFARYNGGGFCPCQQKRVGGILSGGDFVLHSTGTSMMICWIEFDTLCRS